MSDETGYGQVILEQLISTFGVASELAFLATLEAIAAKAGIQTLDDGLSVRDSFYRRKTEETEAMIADFADVNPTARQPTSKRSGSASIQRRSDR